MKKDIPKFLHKTLKDTIGKIKAMRFGVNDMLNTQYIFEKQWDERHIVQRRVTYQTREQHYLHTILDNNDSRDEFMQALADGNVQEANQIADRAIGEYEDYFNDDAYDYGEIIDEEDMDQEYDEHMDSENNIYMNGYDQPRAIREMWVNFLPERQQQWYLNPFRWIFGLKPTPYSETREISWIQQQNNNSELDEYGNAY